MQRETVGSAHTLPPDLSEVAAAWTTLPEVVKFGIVAMVRAASGTNR